MMMLYQFTYEEKVIAAMILSCSKLVIAAGLFYMELAPVTTGSCYEQLRVIPDEKKWCSVMTVSVCSYYTHTTNFKITH